MFLKRSVMENDMTMPKEDYIATCALRAMRDMSESAARNGTADMSLDEINAEIEACRSEAKK